MKLGDFLKNYVELDIVVEIDARYPAEDSGLWFEYCGPVEYLFDENCYKELLNSRLESIKPTYRRNQANTVRLGIIVVRE